MRSLGLVILSVVTMMISCERIQKVEGTVRDITDNTLTISCPDGGIVTFSTRKARFVTPSGIHRGSPVEVSFKSELSDGFGNATRVEAPETYNLLIGRWVAPYNSPYADNPELLHGFELLEDGSVIEIGEHSITYNCWRLRDNRISMAEYVENLDMDSFDFVHHWHIDYLDSSILTISYDGMTKTFARVER